MTAPPKAVFMSYASQDAEAARRICGTLRTGGIDVWFNQSELRGAALSCSMAKVDKIGATWHAPWRASP